MVATVRFGWRKRLRGTPHAVARGLAAGAFVAFTPTFGVQLVLASLVATALGGSRPAALVPVWVTNPLTIPAIYGLTHRVGSHFWPAASSERASEILQMLARQLRAEEPWDLGAQIHAVATLGRDVAIPLWIGGILVGVAVGLVIYPLAVVVGTQVHGASGCVRRRRSRVCPGHSPDDHATGR